MVDAGIARKVDFGEGRSRFEPSYRHPRHFHLVCNSCHRSSEFLSSDVEALIEEIAGGAQFRPRRRRSSRSTAPAKSAAPARKTPPIDGATTELVFARDALRIAIATERSGLEFYTRAAELTSDPRGRDGVPEAGRGRAGAPRHARKALPRAARRPIRSSSRGRRSCSSRARRTACSPKAPSKLRAGRRRPAGAAHRHQVRARLAQVLQALRRALRGLRRQAGLPRVRRRRARPPRPADPRIPRAARAAGHAPPSPRKVARRAAGVRDRSPHPHHRVRRPLHAGASWSTRAARGRRHGAERHRPRHRVRLRRRGRRRAPTAGIEFVPGIEITAVVDERRRPRARLLHRRRIAGRCGRFSPSSAARGSTASAR